MASVICKKCGVEAEWIDCWNGCDDGYFDGYEEDPLWYDDGDLVTCDVCRGRGGWWGCVNKDCPPDAPESFVTYDLSTEGGKLMSINELVDAIISATCEAHGCELPMPVIFREQIKSLIRDNCFMNSEITIVAKEETEP